MLFILAAASPAGALRFGPDEAFELRGKVYSQYTVATEETQLYTQPEETAGNMKQWRNFMNPEFEVDFKLDRATVTGMPIAETTYYIDIDDKIYETDRVIRAGK
jgi:hypothetical protein